MKEKTVLGIKAGIFYVAYMFMFTGAYLTAIFMLDSTAFVLCSLFASWIFVRASESTYSDYRKCKK